MDDGRGHCSPQTIKVAHGSLDTAVSTYGGALPELRSDRRKCAMYVHVLTTCIHNVLACVQNTDDIEKKHGREKKNRKHTTWLGTDQSAVPPQR